MTVEEIWAWGAVIDLYGVHIFLVRAWGKKKIIFLLIHLGKCFKQIACQSLWTTTSINSHLKRAMEGTADIYNDHKYLFMFKIRHLIVFFIQFRGVFSLPRSNPIFQKSSSFSVPFMSTLQHSEDSICSYLQIPALKAAYCSAHLWKEATVLIRIFTTFKFQPSVFYCSLMHCSFSLAACYSLFITKEFFSWFISDCKVVYDVLHGEQHI